MKVRQGIVGGALLAALALSACGGGDKAPPKLMHLRSQTRSPDEFAILPTKPLTMPADLKALPDPTPGGTNITDPTPEADAVAALGGNPAAVTPGKIAAANATLVGYAGRFGTAADIRSVLAAEDLDFRRRHNGRLLQRLFSATTYFSAYRPMELDPYEELAYWRRLGVRNVSAPPESEQKK